MFGVTIATGMARKQGGQDLWLPYSATIDKEYTNESFSRSIVQPRNESPQVFGPFNLLNLWKCSWSIKELSYQPSKYISHFLSSWGLLPPSYQTTWIKNTILLTVSPRPCQMSHSLVTRGVVVCVCSQSTITCKRFLFQLQPRCRPSLYIW